MKKIQAKRMFFVYIMVLFAMLFCSIAWADFYVVASGKKAKKTILVSPKSTQTASGTALLNALSGITDASSTNPYLIIIEPGVYNIGTSSLQMKEYVDIQGSGENVTKIKGTIDGISSGVLAGADNAEVRFLTVRHAGGGATDAIAIFNSYASPKITNVTATSSGGTTAIGVYNIDSSSPEMTNVTATAPGGTHNYGVVNISCSPTMRNVTATASGGLKNCGVSNITSSPTMRNVTTTASGGTTNYGVLNDNSSSPKMINVVATGKNGTNNYGVATENSSTCKIDHSFLRGSTSTVITVSGATTYIGNTRLNGGAVSGSGTNKCAGVYDEDFNFYTSTCP